MNLKNIVLLIAVIIVIIIMTVYLALNRKKNVIEWLKYAVTEAEKQLGEKTGQLKLRTVYNWFVKRFPIMAAVMPFKVFSAWVDVALKTMVNWIDNNQQVSVYVKGSEVTDERNKEEQPESL